ncbi:D-glycero-beta-D-manno-heptose 1-phosphate adenylyltransferase [bacterium]|nr:MAG: D-glycero-beta-D-manno-heptose 1-phosphate adenylyltransferase [bacterium]
MLEHKIKSLKEIKRISSLLKDKGKKIVFTNGCFDLLHYGHVKYLQQSKAKGDILIVAVNSDASVRRIKGKNRPVVSERYRIRVVAALESVDYALFFREDTPLKLIRAIKPDVLVKGADWKKTDIVGTDHVLSYGGKVKTVKFIKNQSTTGLLKKIAKSF